MAVSSWGPRIAFWRETQKKPAPYFRWWTVQASGWHVTPRKTGRIWTSTIIRPFPLRRFLLSSMRVGQGLSGYVQELRTRRGDTFCWGAPDFGTKCRTKCHTKSPRPAKDRWAKVPISWCCHYSRLCVWKLGTPKMDQNGYLNSGKLLEHRLWGILFSGKAIFGILRRISCADEKKCTSHTSKS